MSRRTRILVPAVQILASVGIVVLLVRQAQLDAVLTATAASHFGWLALAFFLKVISLALKEIRLWISLLPDQRRAPWPVMVIGFAGGLVNTVVPMRSGDLFAIVLLRKELDIPIGSAIAAVGLRGFLEALAFAVFLFGVLLMGATRFDDLLGATATNQATLTVGFFALGALVASGMAVAIARRIERDPAPAGPGIVSSLRSAVRATGEHLGHPPLAAANISIAVLQVAGLVGTFWLLLLAIEHPVGQPLLAVAGILAVGSLSSIALPASLGAGPAAVSVFVLGFFGVPEDQALAYAALTWIVNVPPAVLMGGLPLWQRLGFMGQAVAGAEESTPSQH